MVELTDPTDIRVVGTELLKKKPFGKHSVKLPPAGKADAVVNANVADLLAAFTMRSAAAIVNVTLVTCLRRVLDPLTWSRSVKLHEFKRTHGIT